MQYKTDTLCLNDRGYPFCVWTSKESKEEQRQKYYNSKTHYRHGEDHKKRRDHHCREVFFLKTSFIFDVLAKLFLRILIMLFEYL